MVLPDSMVVPLHGWSGGVRKVLVTFGGVLHRRVRNSGRHALVQDLRQVVEELQNLNHQTEQDFLNIGGKLTEFLQAVNRISSEITTLTDLISGEQGQSASSALTGVLQQTEAAAARVEAGTELLNGLRTTAGRVKSTLSEFKGTVSTFRTLGVLTQIETARLGREGADFGNLPEEVKALAESIQSGVESALETAKELIEPIERTLQNVAALEASQSKEMSSVISGVSGRLEAFRERQAKAREASVRLGAQYSGISDSIREVVIAIQFHDITRQQIEHVIEALERLSSEVEAGKSPSSRMLTLQELQLADAEEKFRASVGRIERNLDGITARVHEMAEEGQTLLGLSQGDQASFFADMEHGCATILKSIHNSSEAESATLATTRELGQAIEKMRDSALAIRSIDIHIQRMALNAGIRAAHIGASGEALSVLAGAMQRLGDESGQRSDTIVEALGAMNEALSALSKGADSGLPDARSGETTIQDRMCCTVKELHESSEHGIARAKQVVGLGASLCDSVSTARSGFSAGRLVSEVVGRVRGRLKQMETASADSGDFAVAGQPVLEDCAQHYTMESERDVHASVARAEPLPEPVSVAAETPAPATPASAPSDDTDLGDNVELF